MKLKPLRASMMISIVFLTVSMVYLWTSTTWPLDSKATALEVVRYEFTKGSIFMVVASLGVFGLCYFFMSRLEQQQREIMDTREQLMEAQNRVLTGTLTASVAHDLKNLLSVIEPNLEFALSDDVSEEERRECLEDALLAARGLSSLNERLARVAQQGRSEQPEEADLVELARDALDMVRAHTKLNGRDVDLIARDAVSLEVFPDLAIHAIINLILNSADATDPDGQIVIYVRRRTNSVELEVHDDGVGIPADLRQNLLQPFETTKNDGTGLGLFIVGHFARMHGGHVEIEDSDLGGALVRVTLPRDSEVSLSESDPIFFDGDQPRTREPWPRSTASNTDTAVPTDRADTVEDKSPPLSE
jgi:signal transduction histidine kinase